MEKRGFSNIEMVLAFVIFIAGVLFVVYFLSIGKKNENLSQSLETLREKIISNISSNVKSYSLAINGSLENKIVAVNVTIGNGENVAVFNLSRARMPSFIANNLLYFNSSRAGKNFQIVLSEDIDSLNGLAETSELKKEEDSLGPKIEYSLLSEKKAKALAENYQNNYEKIKEQMRIGNRDFAFLVKIDGNISATKKMPEKVQVFTSEKSHEFILEDGNRGYGNLEVKIW